LGTVKGHTQPKPGDPNLTDGSGGERLELRVHNPELRHPTIVYLPGLHGDWTLNPGFRAALRGRARFVEVTYPRTTTWSLADYAEAVAHALSAHPLDSGWLLGESFGSQVVWALLARSQSYPNTPGFRPEGIILAGGFVRHPWPLAVGLFGALMQAAPMSSMQACLHIYQRCARRRQRRDPEAAASLAEFVARRTEADRNAAVQRLRLIASSDPTITARACHLPVFYLAGLLDPLVPCPWIRAWLKRHCPGYRGGRTFWYADHNVLGSASAPAADQVLHWAIGMPCGA
jgi:pimeloyl-ACP methyl ester carboxylesterase